MADLEEVSVKYRTLEDAARQGLIAALRDTKDGMEYGGIIFKDPKTGLFYRGPMSAGDGKDNIEVRGRPLARGDELAGWYHTHDANDAKGEFSPKDILSTRMSNIPAFLGTAGNRKARVFDPNVDRERRSTRSVKSTQPQPGRPFMDGAEMVPETATVLAMLREPSNGN